MIGRSASYPSGMISSWTISPRIPNIAARPLFNSTPRLKSFSSSSNSSQPKSMYPLRKWTTISLPVHSITHNRALKKTKESNKLNKYSSWDGVRSKQSSNSIWKKSRKSLQRSSSIQEGGFQNSSTGYNLSQESKHRNTSMLCLIST